MAENKKDPISTAGAAMRKAAGTGLFKNIENLYAERVRQLFKKNDDIRDRGLTPPDDVVRETDISYGTDPAQALDIYYPAGASGPLPAIISVHGGGFVYGDKERYQFYCMSLAQRGFAVVNYSYRLAPEHRFPAQLQDTNMVMRMIGGLSMIDMNNLFMVGDSAGAHLACQYCAALTNPGYARTLEIETPPVTIRACAFNCGLYMFDPKKDRMMARCYLDGPLSDYSDKTDLFGNITEDFPPAFIMTSTGDFLQARAEPFAALLTRIGVENELHVYGDEENRPGHVFHCNIRDPLGARCNDDECRFFMRHTV